MPRFRSRLATLLPLAAFSLELAAFAQPAPDAPPPSQPATRPGSQPTTQPASRPGSRPADSGPSQRGRQRRPRDGREARPDSAAATASASASTSSTSTSTASSQTAAEKERFLAVINGRVHTITGPVLDGATVLTRNGKIVAIGNSLTLPQDCEVVDARGRFVYPGLVTAAAAGIHGAAPIEDSTDVYSFSQNVAVAVGITTALSGNEVGKITFGSVEDIPLRRNVYFTLNYSSRGPLERAKLRGELDKVRGYLRDLTRHEIEKQSNKDAKAPDGEWVKGRFEELKKLLNGELVAVASANTAHELIDLADLASAYRFKLVIRGAVEGWIVADALGRAGVSVIMTPRATVSPDDDANRPSGSTIENAKILHDAGVPVAVVPIQPIIGIGGLAGRDLINLNMEAAFAVRGGMENDEAIRTITIDAARILGVDSRVGSIEVGKDADLIVCDGDLLHYMTTVHTTVVNGRVVYEKTKDTLFGHIRPEGKPDIANFDDLWPRRLEWRE